MAVVIGFESGCLRFYFVGWSVGTFVVYRVFYYRRILNDHNFSEELLYSRIVKCKYYCVF